MMLPMAPVTRLIDMALEEDLGPGDVTTEATVAADTTGIGDILAKEPAVIAGIEVARQVFSRLDASIICRSKIEDGTAVTTGQIILSVQGPCRSLLQGERVALNFLQRLCGIATQTRQFVDQLTTTAVRLVDTRKTLPGWRVLDKYAVRVGGAHNHRLGLFDGILIKDNHIAASGGIRQAVDNARKRIGHLMKIEVEVSDLQQVKEAVAAGADVIMLDNMDLAQIRTAVEWVDGRAITEASGGVSLADLPLLENTGVDLISVGALTHSVEGVDLSMRIQPVT